MTTMAPVRVPVSVPSGVARRYRQDTAIRSASGLVLWASCLLVSYW